MQTTNTQLKDTVMRRVRTMHFARRVVKPLVIEGAVLALLCAAVASLVSVPNVMGNMSHLSHVTECAQYLLNAFVHTKLAVQASLVLGILIAMLFVRDAYRNFRHHPEASLMRTA